MSNLGEYEQLDDKHMMSSGEGGGVWTPPPPPLGPSGPSVLTFFTSQLIRSNRAINKFLIL